VKVNSINEFTRAKLKRFGPLGSLIARVNFEKLPLSLQTNLYAIARKRDA